MCAAVPEKCRKYGPVSLTYIRAMVDYNVYDGDQHIGMVRCVDTDWSIIDPWFDPYDGGKATPTLLPLQELSGRVDTELPDPMSTPRVQEVADQTLKKPEVLPSEVGGTEAAYQLSKRKNEGIRAPG